MVEAFQQIARIDDLSVNPFSFKLSRFLLRPTRTRKRGEPAIIGQSKTSR
jgi:hypothetical protein